MFDKIIAFFAPHECLGCMREDMLLCEACIGVLTEARRCCYRCQRAQTQFEICDECRKSSSLSGVWARTNYEHLAKDLVWRMKFGRTRAATRTIASMLLLPPAARWERIVVHVPTATSRVRQRGYDQARLIAAHFARKHGLTQTPALARVGQQRQVGASGDERRVQLETAFRLTRPVTGKHIILVDDVVTSGATLEAAAKVLRLSGAARVDATVFARA